MEVFGDVVRDGRADIGMGLHRFRDPALTEEWSTVTLPIDVAEFHTYAVDWRPGSLAVSVDGEVVREVGQAPDHPVFDFPAGGARRRHGARAGGVARPGPAARLTAPATGPAAPGTRAPARRAPRWRRPQSGGAAAAG